MNLFENKDRLIKYLISILLLLTILYIIVKIFYKEEIKYDDFVYTSTINYSDDDTFLSIEYPRFKDDKINAVITNIVYDYAKDFRNNETKNKYLEITYKLYYIKNFVNIVFDINNSLNDIKYKNLLIDLQNKKLAYISSIYDEDYLSNEINNLVYYKYSSDIYDKVKSSTINNFTYLIDDNKIDVYFNNIEFKDIDYRPYVSILFDSEVNTTTDYIPGKKYISFTYDDGPSEYTSDLLKTLELNNSSATFFMIGNRMKYNKEVVNEIDNSNSEIGMHSYSHKYLTDLDENELLNEINSVNILFNEITSKNITYLRPPYGKYNDSVLALPYKIVLWNIDPKDWLVRDSEKIYNNVIKNACDGCIVLMHDIYPETIEATKKLIPSLNEMGYDVVSISKLVELKNYDIENNNIISIIK